MQKIAVIDNYDSFTYNLVHYLEDLGAEVFVFRNDEFDLKELLPFDKILLSPGPGLPREAGLLNEVILQYGQTKNILGVCLGLQAIYEVFKGKLINLKSVFHGVSSKVRITVDNELLFSEIPTEFEVGRYHSWAANPKEIPSEIEITSLDQDNQIMSIRHKKLNIRGVQFHPESILTPYGKKILQNWIELT